MKQRGIREINKKHKRGWESNNDKKYIRRKLQLKSRVLPKSDSPEFRILQDRSLHRTESRGLRSGLHESYIFFIEICDDSEKLYHKVEKNVI